MTDPGEPKAVYARLADHVAAPERGIGIQPVQFVALEGPARTSYLVDGRVPWRIFKGRAGSETPRG